VHVIEKNGLSYLMTPVQMKRLYTVSKKIENDKKMNNDLKIYKVIVAFQRHYHGIRVERLRKTTKKVRGCQVTRPIFKPGTCRRQVHSAAATLSTDPWASLW
jgi:hypothetical protein